MIQAERWPFDIGYIAVPLVRDITNRVNCTKSGILATPLHRVVVLLDSVIFTT